MCIRAVTVVRVIESRATSTWVCFSLLIGIDIHLTVDEWHADSLDVFAAARYSRIRV